MRSPILTRLTFALLLGVLPLAPGCGGGSTGPPPDGDLPFETFDAGFFSIEKPRGWTVVTAGRCTTFAFLIADPAEPRRQIFYFGTIGPVYLNQAQKDLDAWYMSQGGFPIPWIDAPVVDPLTPENFFAHWPGIAGMAAAKAFMSRFPALADLTVIATWPQPNLLPGSTTAQLRALFTEGDAVAEGLFLATVIPFSPYTGTPAGGNANGHLICGVTAPKEEFTALVDRLVESLETFTISDGYVHDCFVESQATWGAIAEAGRTLSEASDILWEGWERRSHGEDILAEQRTDAFRGVERVYDPDTGEVYTFPGGWYDAYDANRSAYDMSNLQPLPGDDWNLWMAATLDGPAHLH